MLKTELGVGCGSVSAGCDQAGDCPAPPDLCIKRHDTRPHFRVSLSDCDGPVELQEDGVTLEASMWFDAKLKADIDDSSVQLQFADNVGFDSVMVGDVISTSSVRSSESMLVTGVDEPSMSVQVSRGHEGTSPRSWKKGTALFVFRFRDEPAQIESVYEESEAVDGSVTESLVDTVLQFQWSGSQTSVPGCYWIEFKILKISPETGSVEWVKRVPLGSPGFMVRVVDSPTSPS